THWQCFCLVHSSPALYAQHEKVTLIVHIKACMMSSHHDVSVPVDELDELLQTPQAALQAAHYKTLTFCFLVNVLQDNPHDLNQGQDQSTKCQGAQMREHGDVRRFFEGPVVGGERSSQRALSKSNDKVDTPEKSHRIVDLQAHQRVTVLGAIDTTTAAHGGVQSHHFVGGTS
uniref:Uncharacterized protein n=1 Tax=Oreochromis niloticus TaxID=8128 RepID=A0A669DMQ3_ORENI